MPIGPACSASSHGPEPLGLPAAPLHVVHQIARREQGGLAIPSHGRPCTTVSLEQSAARERLRTSLLWLSDRRLVWVQRSAGSYIGGLRHDRGFAVGDGTTRHLPTSGSSANTSPAAQRLELLGEPARRRRPVDALMRPRGGRSRYRSETGARGRCRGATPGPVQQPRQAGHGAAPGRERGAREGARSARRSRAGVARMRAGTASRRRNGAAPPFRRRALARAHGPGGGRVWGPGASNAELRAQRPQRLRAGLIVSREAVRLGGRLEQEDHPVQHPRREPRSCRRQGRRRQPSPSGTPIRA